MNENKLIAEFMGWKQCDPNDNTIYANPTNGALHSSDSDMRFHTSWDWLMPVIDKCYQEHMSKHIADAVMTCNIDEAYKVVVEFIKDQNNMNIEQAKEVLKKGGYFVDNLWNVADVKDKYICDEDTAQDILYKSLTNEATMEQVWLSIDIFSEDLQTTKK
jgi:hypothetical protein